MSRMLFVTLTLIWALPVKAEVLTLSCEGTMKAEEEQAKPQAITKMGLTVNFDAGVVQCMGRPVAWAAPTRLRWR
jgi:hypothetical protein